MFSKRGIFGGLLVSTLLALLSLNCFQEPLSPIAPIWDMDITVPLANRIYTLSEIIAKDTSLLKTGTGNQISVSKTVDVSPTYVNDLLSLSPKDTSVQMAFGAFTVNVDPQRLLIDIPWLPQGATVPIPDTTCTFADLRASIPVFENVTLKSGTVTLLVENKLPVPMEIQSPIRLLNRSGNTVAMFQFNPSTIPPRSSRSATDDLASKTMDSDFGITGLTFHTPGSTTPVTIPNGEMLVATLTTTNLKAARATLADIPAQRLADNASAMFRIDDSTLVKEIHLRSGGLRFAFTNNVQLGMMFKFRFLELERRQGSSYVPYEDSVYLAARGSGSLLLNLANTRIRSLDGNLISALSVLSTVSVSASLGQPVTISETDKVMIAVTKSSSVIVDSAVAVLKPTWVNFDTKVGLNLGSAGEKFTGQINLPSVSLSFSTLSSIGFASDLYARIGARKSAAGDSVFLDIPVSQRRLMPGQDAIRFDGAEVGRFLSQLSGGRLPDSIRLVGKALVNPPDTYMPSLAGVGTVGSKSSIGGSVNINLPLNLGLADGYVRDTLAIGDTTGDGHKDFTLDKEKTKHLNSGKVYVEIENGLPVTVSLNIALLNRVRQNLLSIPQSGVALVYPAASVDADGNVIAAAKGKTLIELNRQEVEQYNPAELVSYGVRLNTTSGSPTVKFKTSDTIRIRVWSRLSARVQ